MEPLLTQLALAQRGVFTGAQSYELGCTDSELRTLVRRREVLRFRRNEYVFRAVWEGANRAGRHVLATRAVLLSRPNALAARHSALAIMDLPLYKTDLSWVAIADSVSRVRRRPGLQVNPIPSALPHARVGADRCVSAELACLQTAETYGLESGCAALDAALQRGIATLARFEELSAKLELTRVQALVHRRLLTLADPKCESVGETRTRLLLRSLGFAPKSQVEIRDECGRVIARVDFLLDDVIVEFDGAIKYEGAEGRAALVREKTREDALRALGCRVVRLIWADVGRPQRVLAKLTKAGAHRQADRSAVLAGLSHSGRVATGSG